MDSSLFRCWKDETPYNEEVYLKALEERNSPLARTLLAPPSPPSTLPTGLKWKTVAGFHKLSKENS